MDSIHNIALYYVTHSMNITWFTASLVMLSWWRHQMETFPALLAFCAGNSPVTGEFTAQRPLTRSFDIFFNLRLNKRLNKQSWDWWFETSSCPLWRRCNVCSSRLVCNHFLHLRTNQVHISRNVLSSVTVWHGKLAQLHDDRYTIYVYKFCHTRFLTILGRSCRGLNTSNETF